MKKKEKRERKKKKEVHSNNFNNIDATEVLMYSKKNLYL